MKETNNDVVLSGQVVYGPEFDHEVYKKKIYKMYVEVLRTSNTADIIPVMVRENMIELDKNYKNAHVRVSGKMLSKKCENSLKVSVFAHEIEFNSKTFWYENEVHLCGYIHKKPTHRVTPLGREISDIFLAVEKPSGRFDYIPCICWGRNARFAEKLDKGDYCAIRGRIQSREYIKKISDDRLERRTVYEVFAVTMEVKNDD